MHYSTGNLISVRFLTAKYAFRIFLDSGVTSGGQESATFGRTLQTAASWMPAFLLGPPNTLTLFILIFFLNCLPHKSIPDNVPISITKEPRFFKTFESLSNQFLRDWFFNKRFWHFFTQVLLTEAWEFFHIFAIKAGFITVRRQCNHESQWFWTMIDFSNNCHWSPQIRVLLWVDSQLNLKKSIFAWTVRIPFVDD